ncbi:hypothetical protein HAX54_021031, partial [Datura stramonium]|nr:hypothetical protein [Datura stramonium]
MYWTGKSPIQMHEQSHFDTGKQKPESINIRPADEPTGRQFKSAYYRIKPTVGGVML